jgi:hypothetical protein
MNEKLWRGIKPLRVYEKIMLLRKERKEIAAKCYCQLQQYIQKIKFVVLFIAAHICAGIGNQDISYPSPLWYIAHSP